MLSDSRCWFWLPTAWVVGLPLRGLGSDLARCIMIICVVCASRAVEPFERGRTGGRPPLKAKDLAAAKALLLDPEITVVQVAKRLGVAASTLYRHLPQARTTALEA